MASHLGDRVPDLVVVADRVQRLCLGTGLPHGHQPYLQQRRIEDRFLGGGVQLEEDPQPLPYGGQSRRVRPADLLQDREQPSLLVVVIEDQVGDVHSSPLSAFR